jgi:hypothetical protein
MAGRCAHISVSPTPAVHGLHLSLTLISEPTFPPHRSTSSSAAASSAQPGLVQSYMSQWLCPGPSMAEADSDPSTWGKAEGTPAFLCDPYTVDGQPALFGRPPLSVKVMHPLPDGSPVPVLKSRLIPSQSPTRAFIGTWASLILQGIKTIECLSQPRRSEGWVYITWSGAGNRTEGFHILGVTYMGKSFQCSAREWLSDGISRRACIAGNMPEVYCHFAPIHSTMAFDSVVFYTSASTMPNRLVGHSFLTHSVLAQSPIPPSVPQPQPLTPPSVAALFGES